MNEIMSFIKTNGIDLSSEGSADRGFLKAQALYLLGLIRCKNMPLLGIEVWHVGANNRYLIDSLAGWIPDKSMAMESVFNEAFTMIQFDDKKGLAIFTLQF